MIKDYARLFSLPPLLRDWAIRSNRMAWIALVGMAISFFAEVIAYLMFRAVAAAFVTQIMIFTTILLAVLSVFMAAPRRYTDLDLSMAALMLLWGSLSKPERERRLLQLRASDSDLSEAVIDLLESEHKDLCDYDCF